MSVRREVAARGGPGSASPLMRAGNSRGHAGRDSVARVRSAGYTGFGDRTGSRRGGNGVDMGKVSGFAALALALAVAGPVVAQSAAPASKSNAQQERMKECNSKAGDRKGDARKEFMSSCLSGKESQQLNAQQQRMKDCNARATGKTGDDRKKFMSACLSSS